MLQLKSKIFKVIFLWVLLGTVVVPFLYAFKYVALSEDDYGRALWDFHDICYNLSHWYFTHNGRIVNALYSSLPIYESPWLQLVLTFNFLLTPIILFLFVNRILEYIGISVEIIEKILVTGIIFALQITSLPLIFEYYYWYAGATAYSFSFLSLLLCLFFVLGILRNKKNSLMGAVLFGVLCAGNNELLILLLNYLLFILVIYCFNKRKDILKKAIILQLYIIITSGIVIFSPGSLHRQNNYENGGDVFGAFTQSLISSFSLFVNELKTLNGILGLATLFIVVIYLKKRNTSIARLKCLHPIALSILSVTALFLLIYVPTYATGGLNYNKGRVANMIQILLLLVLFINSINAVVFLSMQKRDLFKFSLNKAFIAMVIFSLGAVYTSDNIQNIFKDYNQNNFEQLENNRNERVRLMTESISKNVIVPTYRGSLTFPFEDMSSDVRHWYNKDFVNYINVKHNLDIESVSVYSD